MEVQRLSQMEQIVKLFTPLRELIQLFQVQHMRHLNGVMTPLVIYRVAIKKLHLRFIQIVVTIISNHNISIKIMV